MSVVTIRGSTADGSSGVQVAGAVYEGGAGPTVPWGVGVGNKSTFAVVDRTGLTDADAPTGDDLTVATGFGSTGLCDLANSLNASVRATCTVAGATLTGRLVWFDETPLAIGISAPITFTSDATLRLGNASGDFVAIPQLVDCGVARNCRFFVDSVSAGTWAVYVRPC